MDNTRTLEIEGLKVTIDTEKTGSWQAFKLLRKSFEADSDLEQFDVMIKLMEFATDQTEDSIVEFCGGDNAQFLDVVKIVSQIVAGCYPKN